jgi:type I restriction enzyme R subunit
MKEYDKYEKGAANSTKNTKQLEERLSSDKPNDKISITTIQKLNVFISKNFSHTAYDKKIVLIFDECHRSQFGEFHKNITKKFKNYIIFGFTGTPIFVKNSNKMNDVNLQTTEQAFGEMLHSYTIVDAIHDENVLPFRVEYINTLKTNKQIEDAKIYGIETEAALEANERIKLVSQYILEHFNQKTRRNEIYKHNDEKVNGFNSIFCTASISAAKKYYLELNKQNDKRDLDKKLKIATIFSYCVNESEDLSQIDEEMDTNNLDSSSRDFLENAIKDYNKMFKENYSTDGEGFNNYYKDISRRIKSKELDLLIVVNTRV